MRFIFLVISFFILCFHYTFADDKNQGFSISNETLSDTPQYTPKKVNVAVILPLSGVRKIRGKSLYDSLSLIENHIESIFYSPDFSQKFDFNIIDFDDGCKAEKAVQIAKNIKLRNENDNEDDDIYFVIGHYCSDATSKALDIYAEAGVIQISPFSTQTNLTGRSNHFFRLAGRNDRHAETVGLRMNQFAQGGKIALIYGYNQYGRDLSDQVSNILFRSKTCLNAVIDLPNSFIKYRAMQSGTCHGYKKYNNIIKTGNPTNKAAFAELAKFLIDMDIKVVYYGGYYQHLITLLRHIDNQGGSILFFAGDSIQNYDFWETSYYYSKDKNDPIGGNVLFSLTFDASRDLTDRTKNELKRILNKNSFARQRGNRASIQALSGNFAVKDRLFQVRSRFIRDFFEKTGREEFPDLYVLRLFAAFEIFYSILVDIDGEAGHPMVIDCDDVNAENIPITVFKRGDCPTGALGRRYNDLFSWVDRVSIYMKKFGINPYTDYVGFETILGAVNFDDSGEWSNAQYHIYRWVNKRQDRSWLEEPEDAIFPESQRIKFIGRNGDFIRIF